MEYKALDPSYIKVTQIGNAIALVVVPGLLLVPPIIWGQNGWMRLLWLLPILTLITSVVDMILAPRRIRAFGYAEQDDELVIKQGILYRKLEVIPYGRMQKIKVESGPLLRKYGLAKLSFVTASSDTDGSIEGVTEGEAERLRAALTARATANLEGL